MGLLGAVYAKIRIGDAHGAIRDLKKDEPKKKLDLSTEVRLETEDCLKVGDTVKCHDMYDMLACMQELALNGVVTDWDPDEIGSGDWILHVVEVRK